MTYPQAALEDVKSSLWKAEESLTEALRKLDLLIDFRPYLEIKIKPHQRWIELDLANTSVIFRHATIEQMVELTKALIPDTLWWFQDAKVIHVRLQQIKGTYAGVINLGFSKNLPGVTASNLMKFPFIKEGAEVKSPGKRAGAFGEVHVYSVVHSLQFQNKD